MASGIAYRIETVPGMVAVYQLGSAANPSVAFGNPDQLGGMNDGFYATSTPAVGIALNGTSQFLVSAAGHGIWNTVRSNDNIRLNVTTFTTDASIIGVQIKPGAGIALTNGITGLEVEPRINDTFAGTSITAIFAGAYRKGTTGNLSGNLIGVEAKLEADPTYIGTITGPAAAIRAGNDLYGTVTNGPSVIYIVNHGGGVAWDGFVYGTEALGTHSATTSSDKTGNAKSGTLKVKFNNTRYHIQLYADA